MASVRFKIPLLLNNIMEAIMITSENNVKLKEMIKLQKNARHRKKEGLFVAEGIKLVQEAAQYGKLRQVSQNGRRSRKMRSQRNFQETKGMWGWMWCRMICLIRWQIR